MGANCQQIGKAIRNCFKAKEEKEAKAKEEDSTRSMTRVSPSASSPAASKPNPLGKESKNLEKEAKNLDEEVVEPEAHDKDHILNTASHNIRKQQREGDSERRFMQ